ATGEARDLHRNGAVDGGVIAQLSLEVATPTHGCARRSDRTTLVIAGADGDGVRQANDVDRYVAVGRRVIAEFAVIPLAPALHARRGQQSTDVCVADADAGDAAGQTGDVHRRRAWEIRAVAQFTVRIRAPALHAAACRQHAEMKEPGADGADPAAQTR